MIWATMVGHLTGEVPNEGRGYRPVKCVRCAQVFKRWFGKRKHAFCPDCRFYFDDKREERELWAA